MKKGLAREREDRQLLGPDAHIIRSHRKPSTGAAKRVVVGAVATLAVTASLSASVNGGIFDNNQAPANASVDSSTILAEAPSADSPTLIYPIEPDELRNEMKLRQEAAAAEIERQRREAAERAARAAADRQLSRVEVVIRYALAQQGDRYVFATAGPNTFDCSGLVLASFKQVGLKLPHFTGALVKLGTRVSRDSMKRGDIVFPQSGHVGIYLGGGQMVHASGSQQRVVVGKVYGFYAARRLI